MTAQRPDGWTAVELLPPDADRQQWLAARRAGLGGSDASVVSGVNPWRTRYQLWLDKTGTGHEDRDTPAMRWGRLLEPVLVRAFTEDTGLAVTPCGLVAHRDRDWQRYTPDGLTSDGGLFEAKTTGPWGAGEWDDAGVADHAWLQVQHGMAVTGLPHAWVVVLVAGQDFRVRRVERDEAMAAQLTELERVFWTDHVLAGVPPRMDAGDLPRVKAQHPDPDPGSVLEGGAEALALVEDVRVARAEARDMARARDALEAQLLALLGVNERLTVHGAVRATATTTTTRRLDTRRIRAERPELVEPYLTTSTRRTLKLT